MNELVQISYHFLDFVGWFDIGLLVMYAHKQFIENFCGAVVGLSIPDLLLILVKFVQLIQELALSFFGTLEPFEPIGFWRLFGVLAPICWDYWVETVKWFEVVLVRLGKTFLGW